MLYVAREVPRIRRNTLLLLIPTLTTTALLFIAGKQTGVTQTALWVAAPAMAYIGAYLIRPEGWQISAVSHFAERHGLMIIIALGESVVSIGIGVSKEPVSWQTIGASVLGIAALAAMWWAYFDVAAIYGENALHRLSDEERPRMARDLYTFLHYPMVAAIILVALGLKKAFQHLGDPVQGISLYALYGGASLYLVALALFKLRHVKTITVQRVIVAALLLALIPMAGRLSALAALLLFTVVLLTLICYEVLALAPLREQVRHGS
jgi:low temperature requirement protein LtrA